MKRLSEQACERPPLRLPGLSGEPRGPAPVGGHRSGPDIEGQLREGIGHLERGHLSAAVAHFQAALALDPASVRARTHLAIAYAVGANVHRAIEVFEEALALSPGDFLANVKLGELYLRLCIPEKGRRYLEIAQEVSRTPTERELVRRLLAFEAGREKRRIDRPSFGPRSGGWGPGRGQWWDRLRTWCGAGGGH